MKRFRRVLFRLLCTSLLLIAIAFAIIGWRGSGYLVSPERRTLQDYHREILFRPVDHGLQVETFTAGDETPCLLVTGSPNPGRAEKSRAVRAELSRRGMDLPSWGAQIGTIVMFYGHRGRKEDHLPICERFCAAGFRCVLLDIPGQGDHPAAVGTFGLTESKLAGEVLNAAAAKFAFAPSPAFLFGISQGGAISLQAAAREPSKWSGVASVSTFASLDRPVRQAAHQRIPDDLRFFRPLAAFSVACGTKLRAGFWPSDVRPVDSAAKLSLPVFIAHGDYDRSIGIDQAKEIFAALPDPRKQFKTVHGGDHGRVLATGSNGLYADLCQFFLAALDPGPAAAERPD